LVEQSANLFKYDLLYNPVSNSKTIW
jgi:hypothetical protein